MTHVLTTMQTAGIVRAVFIKTTKKFDEGMQEQAKHDLKDTFKTIFDLSIQKDDDLEKHLSHNEIEEIEALCQKTFENEPVSHRDAEMVNISPEK